MDPITIALLAGGAGGAIGAFFGWLFGTSQAQEEIDRLQKLVMELVRVNKRREAEIRALENRVGQLEMEIAAIKASRSFVQAFIRWVAGEHPEIIARFQEIEAVRGKARAVQETIDADNRRLDAEIAKLQLQYPDEMRAWESRLR